MYKIFTTSLDSISRRKFDGACNPHYAGAVTALVIEASKETSKAIIKGGTDLVSKLVSLVHDRFKDHSTEKFLVQVQEEPAEANKAAFSAILTAEFIKDPNFADTLTELLKQLKMEGDSSVQEILTDIEVEGSLEVEDVTQ